MANEGRPGSRNGTDVTARATSLLEPAGRGWAAHAARTAQRVAPLLDMDPDLARRVPPHDWDEARRRIQVRAVALPPGSWPVERLAARPGDLGVLVVQGILGRELLAHDVASMELLGPGDLLRPAEESAAFELLEAGVRWSALADTRVAILDERVAQRLPEHPELYVALLERCAERFRRLAVMQAISQLNGVERRLLTVLWHLAERWGRVTPDGVLLSLTLSHRTLGQLVGARRPTVSTALGELTRAGELARGEGGTWRLTGTPVGAPDGRSSRFVKPRRSMLPRGHAASL